MNPRGAFVPGQNIDRQYKEAQSPEAVLLFVHLQV